MSKSPEKGRKRKRIKQKSRLLTQEHSIDLARLIKNTPRDNNRKVVENFLLDNYYISKNIKGNPDTAISKCLGFKIITDLKGINCKSISDIDLGNRANYIIKKNIQVLKETLDYQIEYRKIAPGFDNPHEQHSSVNAFLTKSVELKTVRDLDKLKKSGNVIPALLYYVDENNCGYFYIGKDYRGAIIGRCRMEQQVNVIDYINTQKGSMFNYTNLEGFVIPVSISHLAPGKNDEKNIIIKVQYQDDNYSSGDKE